MFLVILLEALAILREQKQKTLMFFFNSGQEKQKTLMLLVDSR